MTTARATILLSGMIAADPHQGGATWAVLQYVLGFRRLGHDVHLIEPLPALALRAQSPLATSANAAYFRRVADDFRLTGTATLLRSDTRETVGTPYEELVRIANGADVLINISGMLADPELIRPIPTRV